jgi:hypothetical protein
MFRKNPSTNNKSYGAQTADPQAMTKRRRQKRYATLIGELIPQSPRLQVLVLLANLG